MIVIKVVKVRFPVEHFQVLVNGSLLNTFMSKAQAEAKKDQLLHAWNVENVGQSTRKMVG
jgi:hypothetical protein